MSPGVQPGVRRSRTRCPDDEWRAKAGSAGGGSGLHPVLSRGVAGLRPDCAPWFCARGNHAGFPPPRSEEHTSELQSLMRISYAVFCLKKKNQTKQNTATTTKE